MHSPIIRSAEADMGSTDRRVKMLYENLDMSKLPSTILLLRKIEILQLILNLQ